MTQIDVDIHEIPARIQELLGKAAAGDRVVITGEGQPLGVLLPLTKPQELRPLGLVQGTITENPPGYHTPLMLVDDPYCEDHNLPPVFRPMLLVNDPDADEQP
ncbi:MAG: hypothetical protein LC104_04000 [Bacteroidales bacterium]|nr:hypothetical protein [Bacteroidales bacterium]